MLYKCAKVQELADGAGRVCNVIPAERRQRLLAWVRRQGVVSLAEASDELGVSLATVRRDLDDLAGQHLLVRTRGGATVPDGYADEPTFMEKSTEARLEKEAIGRAAAELVAPGDPILIGPGTTTLALARELRSIGDLTVVTNSLLVVEALLDATGIDLIVTGGSFRHSIRALVGPGVTESLSRLRLPTVFISGNGLSATRGLSTPDVLVAWADRDLLASAERCVVLADHTKFGKERMWVTAPPERIDVLITDDEAPSDELVALADTGMETVVAPGQPTRDLFG